MTHVILPDYDLVADSRAAAERERYRQHKIQVDALNEAGRRERHCAPIPRTQEHSEWVLDAAIGPWRAEWGSAYQMGFGKTEDQAVSDYYAVNNTTDRFPKVGVKGMHA